MFNYDDMAGLYAQLQGRDSKDKAAIKTRLRNFRANDLIRPQYVGDVEAREELLFSAEETCKGFVLNTLGDFGCAGHVLKRVSAGFDASLFGLITEPGVVAEFKPKIRDVIDRIKTGEAVWLCVAIVGRDSGIYWPKSMPDGSFARQGTPGFKHYETAPNGPLIVLPLHHMLKSILELRVES